MALKKNQEFFKDKKAHSCIKHILFKETLNASIGIANNMGWINSFIYMDLFAGKGLYDDKKEGSPLIALDLLKKHIDSENNNFKTISLIAIEKNIESSEKLFELLKGKMNNYPIKILKGDKKWENYFNDLKKHLSSNKGGFIFIDPYALELDLLKLSDLMIKETKFKDIMFLINRLSMKRIFGSKGINASEIKKYGIDPELIKSQEDLSEEIKKQIRSKFEFKDFTIGLAIPIEKKKKLLSIDYFYLVLTTNSVGVADSFLNSYQNIVEVKQQSKGLFTGYELKNSIQKILKGQNELNFYNLVDSLYNDFLSWKDATKIPGYKVPTTGNIIENINNLLKEGKLDLLCDDKYKTGKGHLSKSIKSKAKMKYIYLKLK
jgi:three-Cys-motif partner protein